ncbi:MAG: patatin [Nitrosomonas sp.]|nr:MAG: patatin [Nitrosomonas sp.]
MTEFAEHLRNPIRAKGKKRILTCDGGGILGLMAVEVLGAIETLLRKETGKPDLVLGDWFDMCAGTSTGAMIATCVAYGMPVDEIRKFYTEHGRDMFDKAFLLKRIYYSYDDEPLAKTLKKTFGEATTLGTDRLRTLLMVVTRNATTDSPWPITNNPYAKYNDSSRNDCNLKLPLWKIVRASTAAPTYFPPERVSLGTKEFMFVDGGVTTYNNPALLAFNTVTASPYGINWLASEDKLFIVSLGCGSAAAVSNNFSDSGPNLLNSAINVISGLMNAATAGHDMTCRILGKCLYGEPIDREIWDLVGTTGPAHPKLFTYLRYNPETTREGLDRLDLTNIDPKRVQTLDAIDAIPDIQAVGQAMAKKVKLEHFQGFI